MLLDLLPDSPRWVELRGALIAGGCEICEPATLAPPSVAIVNREWELAWILGHPAGAAIECAAAAASEILTLTTNADWADRFLPGWTGEPAALHTLPVGFLAPADSSDDAGFADAEEIRSWTHLPARLFAELTDAAAQGAKISVSYELDVAVSFCYAGAVTESFWDVSIDTLDDYRRRGHAQRAFLGLMDYWLERGREPVWGAVRTNIASLRLARKIGFREVDELLLYSRRD